MDRELWRAGTSSEWGGSTWRWGGCQLKSIVIVVARWEDTGDLGESQLTGLGGRCLGAEAEQ